MRASRDNRLPAIAGAAVAILAGGALLSTLGEKPTSLSTPPLPATSKTTPADPKLAPKAHAREAREAEIARRFQQGVVMLHAKQFDHAIVALHRVLELSPQMPEAHVNMGFALLGKEDYKAARDFFATAIELHPEQNNAYYGLAISLEELEDIRGALGAMETYVHLAKAEGPHLRKARAATWELREQLKSAGAPQPTVAEPMDLPDARQEQEGDAKAKSPEVKG